MTTSIASSSTQASKKAYRLSYEMRPEYLYVLIEADKIDYEIARSYWDEITELRERLNTRLLLVDKDVRAQMSTGDEFRIAAEIANEAFRRVKLALCDRHVSPENLAFGETVATNRGLNTKSFREAGAAEKWLLKN
jgi:hypothetical protein